MKRGGAAPESSEQESPPERANSNKLTFGTGIRLHEDASGHPIKQPADLSAYVKKNPE